MKNIYIILLVVTLLGGLGTVAFFVTKKKRDSKKSSPKAPVITPEEKAAIVPPKSELAAIVPPKLEVAPSIPRKPLVKESLEMDIKVPHVDIRNRSFDYSMHYKGIQHKGAFQDGITNMVHVKKGFGSFVVSQRKDNVRVAYDIPLGQNTAKNQKVRGGTNIPTKGGAVRAGANTSTKGGAVKAGATGTVTSVSMANTVPIGTGISGVRSLNSDWVDLFIADTQDRVLKQLSINLRTGEVTNANLTF
jgi:hypothetical protein